MSRATLFIDGAPASPDDLAHQALVNYGAYTSFRVEDGAVRGLDLHLARLETAARELFGETPGEARLRDLMRQAVGDRRRCWLRVSLFSRDIGHRTPDWTGAPSVMVGVFDPPAPLASALRVQAQAYQREAAHLKHVATFGLVRARRAARAAGFDDALFVDAEGRVTEGTLWNVGFVRDDTVVWPQAPMLAGVTQALIQRGLEGVGLAARTEPVDASELSHFDAAFICNSATPACALTAVGETAFPIDAGLIARLEAAWASNPLQVI